MQERLKRPLMVDERERATVLAALRYWAREGLASDGGELDIATSAGQFEALSEDEVADLCDRINYPKAE